jgi:hypothetical protein
MSAAIFDIRSGRVMREQKAETDVQEMNRRIVEKLRGKVRGEIIAVAQLRAHRIMRCEKTTVDRAIQRAIAWAVCSDDEPTPPPSAA